MLSNVTSAPRFLVDDSSPSLFTLNLKSAFSRGFSFRKLQIFISQTTDSHFANYRFSFRKLQIFISQTTDFHFVSFHFVSFHFVSLHFVSQTTVSHKSLRKIQNTEQITRDFCCIFYRFVDFLTLNTLTQLYLKNLYTFRTNIVSSSYRIIKGLAPTVIRIWLCFGQRSRFFARF